MKLVTPYLPPEAKHIIASWEHEHNKPAFIVPVEYHPNWLCCPNCNGLGGVFVKLCSAGPYQTTRLVRETIMENGSKRDIGLASTWFDGNGQWGKGFYIVKETMGFVCPKCNGVAREPGEPITPERIIELKAMETNLVRRLK